MEQEAQIRSGNSSFQAAESAHHLPFLVSLHEHQYWSLVSPCATHLLSVGAMEHGHLAPSDLGWSRLEIIVSVVGLNSIFSRNR